MDKDQIAELEKQAGEIRPDDFRWWKPEPEEAITGIITFIGERAGKFGAESIIKIRDARDILWAKSLTSALKKAAVEQNLTPGDCVTVKYFGEHELDDGRTYQNFKVVIHEKVTTDDFPS